MDDGEVAQESTPSTKFAAYPRGDFPDYGTSEKLQALSDGYFGLSHVFLIYVLVNIGFAFLISMVQLYYSYALYAIALIVLIVLCSSRVGQIAYGKSWPAATTTIVRGFMALNFLFCGVFGVIGLQLVVAREMSRYGIRPGVFGVNKNDINRRVEEMRSKESGEPDLSCVRF